MPIGNTASKHNYRKSRIRSDQARTQIQAMELKVRNDVESDMRALVSARLQIQVADKYREQAEVRMEEYRKGSAAGTVTAQDYITAEADLASARNSQIEAAETYAGAVVKLWRDTGELLDKTGVKVNMSSADGLMNVSG